MSSKDLGLYVHIPFCRERCHFCAFYLEVARQERMDAFCLALGQEVQLAGAGLADRPVVTVYVGGGTPTVLPAWRLAQLLKSIRSAWRVMEDAEITVEAHPSTVTTADLVQLREAGVNRVSFGVESLRDEELAAIGRPGLARATEAAVHGARAAGFSNINLDLMYGLPGQTLTSWSETLRAVAALDPSHVSCYALTVEPGTRLASEVTRGRLLPPDESMQNAMETDAEMLLSGAGYRRYELSNYAKPGWACRHNVRYWTDQDYLGMGPSAQSYMDGVRFGDVSDLSAYLGAISGQSLPVTDRLVLSPEQRQREALIFGLRLIDGVSRHRVAGGADWMECEHRLARLASRGLVQCEGDWVRLTKLGQRYADTVAGELF